MRILIADAEEDARTILRKILEDAGYECLFVEGNSRIIDKVYIVSPHVIFLGTRHSKPSGLEILKKLKSAPSTRDIPVILIGERRMRRTLAKGYELGAYDYISRPFFDGEVLARIRNIAYIREKTKELEFMMERDYLTDIYNRKFFMNRLIEDFAWSISYSEPLSILMLDIDHFKRINDTYGHRCGDEALKKLAGILLSALRKEDVVARYGGEEFIILLSNTDAASAADSAEKLRAAVQEGDLSCEEAAVLPVTVSIGVATYDGKGELSPDNLIRYADNALYQAKTSGRNRVCIYGSSLPSESAAS